MKYILTGWITISQSVQQAMMDVFPVLKDKPHLLLMNGIDPNIWYREKDKEPIIHLISMVTRLSAEKGIERSIYAIKMLKKRGVKVQLNIWGEGPQESELRQLLSKLGLEDMVYLKGFSDDLPKELQMCSLFLFTPKFGEGSSRVLLEAMALELPCIVMDSPSMDEVVVDGKTGYVVPDGNIDLLADRIQYLLENPQVREEMGKRGRALVLEKFTFNRAVNELVDWLDSK